MFKVFSRPQIDLEDIMNLKGCSVCGRKWFGPRNFGTSRNPSQVFWLHRKERNNADKLLRLEDVKYQRILIMKNQIVYWSKTKIKQDSSGNYFSSIKNQWCFTKWCFGIVDLYGTLGIVDFIKILIADLWKIWNR
jgi:hypothetical protein